MDNVVINFSAEDLFKHYENFCFERGIVSEKIFLETIFSITDFSKKIIEDFGFHKFFVYSKDGKCSDISHNFIFTRFNSPKYKDGFTLVTKINDNIKQNSEYLQKLHNDCIIVSDDKNNLSIYQKTSIDTFQLKYCYSYSHFLNNLFTDSNLRWYAEYLISDVLKIKVQSNDDITFIKKQLVNYFEYFNFKPYCNTEYYMSKHKEIFNEKLKEYFIKLNYGV